MDCVASEIPRISVYPTQLATTFCYSEGKTFLKVTTWNVGCRDRCLFVSLGTVELKECKETNGKDLGFARNKEQPKCSSDMETS